MERRRHEREADAAAELRMVEQRSRFLRALEGVVEQRSSEDPPAGYQQPGGLVDGLVDG
jgi:hypothetical protein